MFCNRSTYFYVKLWQAPRKLICQSQTGAGLTLHRRAWGVTWLSRTPASFPSLLISCLLESVSRVLFWITSLMFVNLILQFNLLHHFKLYPSVLSIHHNNTLDWPSVIFKIQTFPPYFRAIFKLAA